MSTLTKRMVAVLATSLVVVAAGGPSHTVAAAGGCDANAVTAENCLKGNPSSEWDVSGVGDPTIQGFATNISVNRGQTVSFKIDSEAADYRVNIYRLGYYQGLGARRIATITPADRAAQPNCVEEAATGLVDCSNWRTSASWAVPAGAVSGLYIARPTKTSGGGASHIPFIVRDDASRSDVVFQTSDPTWQAYNTWGGNSFYAGSPAGRAYKVSYNRPFNTRSVDGGQDWLFHTEYPMIRWLERNGYDMSYISGVDTDRAGARIRQHKTFLSVGHDEYWSEGQRSNVESARDAGVNLAFFSGNEVYWRTRWEDGYRTLVCYKETHANGKIDPDSQWTGTWRDPRFGHSSEPENALTGQLFMVNAGANAAIKVPADHGRMRFWRNTAAASGAITLPQGTLGYEWDADVDNGSRPAGLVRLSATHDTNNQVLQDWGSTFGDGTVDHALSLYRQPRGGLVFGAGTVQWSWGLDAVHSRPGVPVSGAMQQATMNLLADMDAPPATPMSGVVVPTKSTDTAAPRASVSSPAPGAVVPANSNVTIRGTATDSGGGVVAGVEVSVDGGRTWHPATGRSAWTYTWRTQESRQVTVLARAVDDSANLQGTPSTSGPTRPAPPVVRAPGAPSGVRVSSVRSLTPKSAQATVVWNAPAGNGGSAAAGYRVRVNQTRAVQQVSGTAAVVSGLRPGTRYTFSVSAGNKLGWSPFSAASPVLVPPAPRAGVGVKAVSRGGKLRVNVNPNKGSGYWKFTVQKRTNSGTWRNLRTYRTKGKSETRTLNLAKGTYRVRVKAKYGYAANTSTTIPLSR